MGMPVSAAGDQSMGHGFSPSGITPTQATVLVGGKVCVCVCVYVSFCCF